MATNLIETMQSRLGYPPLQKIDPNTGQEKNTDAATNNLGQAVIPVALLGLYKFTRSHDNADMLSRGNNSTGWAKELFGDDHTSVVNRIAAYANTTSDNAEVALDNAMYEAVAIINEDTKQQENGDALRTALTNERSNILLYLPPALQMGEVVQDNAMDDRTNKMEGPVSSFLHTVEKIFSGSDSDKDQKV